MDKLQILIDLERARPAGEKFDDYTANVQFYDPKNPGEPLKDFSGTDEEITDFIKLIEMGAVHLLKYVAYELSSNPTHAVELILEKVHRDRAKGKN